MALNLSKYSDGTPATLKGGLEDFKRKVKEIRERAMFGKGGYAVLKTTKHRVSAGGGVVYSATGYPTFFYATKPKSRKGVLKIQKVKREMPNAWGVEPSRWKKLRKEQTRR
jgi:hypothetical protein